MLAPLALLSLEGLSAAAGLSETSKGTVTGSTCSGTQANFFAIPYAEPPTGDLRYAAPQPFNGTYASTLTTKAPSCNQFGTTFIETDAESEDWYRPRCFLSSLSLTREEYLLIVGIRSLYINVWRPANTTSTSKLPVKVWFYGGSDTAGGISDAMYNGCELATDAVVVSANYRLGPFGWLSLLSANLTGNFGTQDQLLALQWVQENVADFGGDPVSPLLLVLLSAIVHATALS